MLYEFCCYIWWFHQLFRKHGHIAATHVAVRSFVINEIDVSYSKWKYVDFVVVVFFLLWRQKILFLSRLIVFFTGNGCLIVTFQIFCQNHSTIFEQHFFLFKTNVNFTMNGLLRVRRKSQKIKFQLKIENGFNTEVHMGNTLCS